MTDALLAAGGLFAFLFLIALLSIGNRLGEIRDELRRIRAELQKGHEGEARQWQIDREARYE